MRFPPSARLRLIVAGVVLSLIAGGCAKAAPEVEIGTGAGAVFDQSLRDKLPQRIQQGGVIRLATDPSYAPMESFAADGQTIIGFEPDLADALGGVLGVRVTLVPADFGLMLAETKEGTFDGVLSSMNDTAPRQKLADFIDYFSAGLSIVVQRGNPMGITDLAGLCGQTVALEKGTVQVDLLRRSQPSCGERPMMVRTYKTNADALLQVRTGRASATLNDYPPAAYLAADVRTRSYYQLASTVQYEPGLFGLAIAKGNTELREALHGALDEIMKSGLYAELLQRWGLSTGALTASSINAGAVTGG
jgi:polar amino acid transport system substrate-binding protein